MNGTTLAKSDSIRRPSLQAPVSARTLKQRDGKVSARHLQEVLEKAVENVAQQCDRVDLSILSCAEVHATKYGVSNWAYATHRMVGRLIHVARAYCETGKAYSNAARQVYEQKRRLLLTPVLDVLNRLRTLSNYLAAWEEPVQKARMAFDNKHVDTKPTGSEGILVPGKDGRVLNAAERMQYFEEWMEWEGDVYSNHRTRPDILGPQEKPNAFKSKQLEKHILKVLEVFIDAVELIGGPTRTQSPFEMERHSPFLSFLISSWSHWEKDWHEEELPSHESCSLKIGYWSIRGLGAPMRMMCYYSGVHFENATYEVKQKGEGRWVSREWENDDKPDLEHENALMELPYVKNMSTGEVVTQANAVSLYLGRLLALNGPTVRQESLNEQVLFFVYNIFTEMFDLVYPFKGVKDDESFLTALPHYFRKTIPYKYAKLEHWLEQLRTGYFVDVGPCTADFYAWEVIDEHELMARKHSLKSPVEEFPCLKQFYQSLRADPRLQAYFDSADYLLPCNNKMAFFA